MKISAKIYNLKSKYPFRIAHGVRLETETVIVTLSDGNNIGLGEATPVPYYGISAQEVCEQIELYKNEIEQYQYQHPAQLWNLLNGLFKENNFAKCAIDMAAYDLWAKKQNLPLNVALGLNAEKTVCSNYTIGIDSAEIMIQKLKEIDFPIFKIKLGTEHDINIIEKLRAETNAVLG